MSRRGRKNYIRRPDVVERIGSYLGTSFPLFHGPYPPELHLYDLAGGGGHRVDAAAVLGVVGGVVGGPDHAARGRELAPASCTCGTRQTRVQATWGTRGHLWCSGA